MRKLLLLPCLLLLASCVATTIETQRLPEADKERPFTSLMVFAAGMKLSNAKRIEATMVQELAPMGVKVESGLAHLPYDATPDAVFAKVAELPVEGLIVISQEDYSVEKTVYPPVWVEGKKGKPGYFIPPSTGETHTGTYAAHLYTTRVKSNIERIWLADVGSQATMGEMPIYEEVARQVVDELKSDGMVVDARPKN